MVFIVWFMVDSIYFVNPDMPSLRARQMLAFPFGIVIADYRSEFEKRIKKGTLLKILSGGGWYRITLLIDNAAL